MSFIKKKLGALIPGDSARGALQNVLTVEWSGHKTVLLEVPSGPSRSNDVEMLGMGESSREYGSYGRLGDDDEDERVSLTASFKQTQVQKRDRRPSGGKNQKSLPALPERPAPARQHSNNPFLWDEVDDFGASLSGSGYGGSGAERGATGEPTSYYPTTRPSFSSAIKAGPDAKSEARLYDSSGAAASAGVGGRAGGGNKVGNPWSSSTQARWDNRNSIGSPTTSSSSRTTAESFTIDEDPFR